MNVFRRLAGRRLAALLGAIAGVGAAAAAIAVVALGGGGATPPPEPLAQAIHDALAGPPLDGVTARISFANHLLGSDALGGLGDSGSPLLSGASGRLWLTGDGRLRLELQSDAGDVQIVTNGQKLTVYDGTSNTAYELSLPADASSSNDAQQTVPAVTEITDALTSLGEYADVSTAVPDSAAGRPAYTVDLTPKDGSGLLGGGEISFDAATGVPLKLAIDARGSSTPVLELTVTDIAYGPVSASDVDVTPPAGAKIVAIPLPSGTSADKPPATPVTGVGPVAAAVPFALVAPDSLAGLARSEVRLVGTGAEASAVLTYGQGLGTIVVSERAAAPKSDGSGPLDMLPSVTLGGVTGHELVTALGSLVSFEQAGVAYSLAGSVGQTDAETAARSLAS